MNVGDKVISKKMGPPATGTVVVIYDASYFFMNNPGGLKAYKKEYPEMKRVCGVILDHPIRPFTKESFHGANKTMQYLCQPASTFLHYPEDDLEVFDHFVEEPEQTEEYQDFDSFPGQFEV